jgi:hypothetical protein
MSHKKLREEPTCLNCGHIVDERYCTHCGQENIKIQDSTFQLIIEYIHDMFHYDGKFWHTLKTLILKPGLVAQEYLEGKRNRNLAPLRFYVFASTVFFLILFYTVKVDKWNNSNDPKNNFTKRLYGLEQEKKYLGGSQDTTYVNLLIKSLRAQRDSLRLNESDTSSGGFNLNLGIPAVSDSTDDGGLLKFLENRAEERKEEMEKKHEGDNAGVIRDFAGEIFHKLPQLLFLSLPFFALLLKLMYIRSRKLTYVSHFIFSIYLYAYLFVIMTLFLIIQNTIGESMNPKVVEVISYVSGGLSFYSVIYLLLSMKRFYHDRWRFLIPRYILCMLLFTIIIIILFIALLIVTYLW